MSEQDTALRQQSQTKDTYSKPEAAQRIGISLGTLHKLTMRGDLRVVRVGRRVLIPKTELERFLSPEAAQVAA